jgi:kynurenine formamidase
MTRRFVDLSIYLENSPLSDPPPLAPKITYQTHQDTIKEFVYLLPGTKAEDFPDGEAAAAEWVTLTTHNGTHLDAPYHFHSTMNKGERSITIDEVPLEWCFQPGVKLDFRHLPDGHVVTAAVRLTGTDAWSWDAPFSYTAKKFAATGDKSLLWEGHKAGRDIGYCHLEKLHNLEVLPADGFFISCFPHKIRGASAGWTRAVAIFDSALQRSD